MHKRKPFLLRVWDYFRPSWEGRDGKFSYRRASQFIFVHLMIILVIRDRIQHEWAFYTFVTLAILFALITGILTVEQLIILSKNVSRTKTDIFTNTDTIHETDLTAADGTNQHIVVQSTEESTTAPPEGDKP